MNIARSSVKIFVAKSAMAGITFLGIAFFSRRLGPSQIGIYFLFTAVLGLIAIPADFGLRDAVQKRISEGESRDAYFTAVILLKLAPLSVIIASVLLFRRPINDYLGADLAVHLAVAIVLWESARLTLAVLQGELRVGETAVLQASEYVVWVVLGAALVFSGYGVRALVYSLFAGLGTVLVWGWYKQATKPGRPGREHAASLLTYGRYSVISSIGGYVYNWMDIVLIGAFLTNAHVGAYEVAWRVTMVVLLLSQSIATTIFPQVSRWEAENAKHRVEAILPGVITFSLILVIPAFFGTLVLSREILTIVFGPEYAMAWLVLIILMFDSVTGGFHLVLGRSLQAIDRPDLAARATLVDIVLNLVLNVVLILQFGIVGAAIATTVASLVGGAGLHSLYLSRLVDVKVNYGEIGWSVAASVAMTAILVVVTRRIRVDTAVELVAVICIGVFVYGVLVLSYRSLREKVINNARSVLA